MVESGRGSALRAITYNCFDGEVHLAASVMVAMVVFVFFTVLCYPCLVQLVVVLVAGVLRLKLLIAMV